MAKTKTKEKVVDLTPKAQKITDEQLKEVQNLVNDIILTSNNVGAIATNDEFMNAKPITIKLGFRNPR